MLGGMNKLSLTYTVFPCFVAGITLFSFLSIASFLGNYHTPNKRSKKPNTQKISMAESNASYNDVEDTSDHAELNENKEELQELNEIVQSSNRRKDFCNTISNRYPVTSRISSVVQIMDDLKQKQSETEFLLEEQKKLTEKERELRLRVEESLKAESKLREEAENNIQIYQRFIKQMRNCETCKAFLSDN